MIKPTISLSLGAGVQSSTLALMAATGELPVPDLAIFADTQDEPESVYEWLEWLQQQFPFPLAKVTAGRLSERVLKIKTTADGRNSASSNIPAFCRNVDGTKGKIQNRGCTVDFKIQPIIQHLRDKVIGKERLTQWRGDHKDALKAIRDAKKAKRAAPNAAWQECQDDALVVQWIGISLDEVQRMKPSRDPWIRCEWPLIARRMSRHDCHRWLASHNFPEPPRSACVFCPFHSDAEWRRLRDEEPKAFADAVQFDYDLRKTKAAVDNFHSTPYLHRSLMPLDKVDFSTDTDKGQLLLWGNECEGMCGV